MQVLEVDTDGIYFVPPDGTDGPAAEEKLMTAISRELPEGIRLELDGRYRGMFNYKMKNYVLLDEEGRLVVKGSGLRSRGLEPFQRQWMNLVISTAVLRLLIKAGSPQLVSMLSGFTTPIFSVLVTPPLRLVSAS